MPQEQLTENARQNAVVALGSNMDAPFGNPAVNIAESVSRIGDRFAVSCRVSPLYRTPSFPPGSGPDYVNACLAFDTDLPAGDILDRLHAIEAEFGRARLTRWGKRTLDLDLVALGSQVLPDARTQDGWRALPLAQQTELAPVELILPHPRMQDRAFVLVPMADVAPDWVHPRLGLSVEQMLAQLDPADVRAVQRMA